MLTLSTTPTSHFHSSQYPGVPTQASNVPTPMEIDATRRRNQTPMLCRRCGEPGHFARECPKGYDVRYMMSDERQDWIEHLLTGADTAALEATTPTAEVMDEPQKAVSEEGFVSHSG